MTINPQTWIDAGISLCAVHNKHTTTDVKKQGKCPYPDDWNNRPLKKWDGKSNLGLIHGLNGTMALDLDHLEYAKIALDAVGLNTDHLLSIGLKVIGNPDNRAKALFRMPDDVTLERVSLVWPSTVLGQTVTILELRGGACQDVIFGQHPMGHDYQLGGDLLDMPMIPSDLVHVWQNWAISKPVMLAACPWSKPKEIINKRLKKSHNLSNDESVIIKFNQNFSPFELLMQNGYTRHEDRLLHPSSKTGMPSVKMFDDHHFYSWGGDIFGDGLPHDAFDVFTYFEHNGDTKAAVKSAAQLFGMERQLNNIVNISEHKEKEHVFKPEIEVFKPKETPTVNIVPPVEKVQELIEWMAQANGATPAYALVQSALAFCSAIFARRYAFDERSPINLYLGCHTDSVVQLSSLIGVLQGAVADCGERKMIKTDAFSSNTHLKKALFKSPRLLWNTLEYCRALSFSAKQNNSRGYDSALNSIITIYSGGRLMVDAETFDTKHDAIDIWQPALTILAFAASGEIPKITKKEEYDRGTLQQLFLIEGGPTQHAQSYGEFELPQYLIDYFKSAKPSNGNLAGIELPSTKPKYIKIESEINFNDYDSEFDQLSIEYKAWAGIPLGWKKIFKRICGCLAVADNLETPIVTQAMGEWAKQWVLFHLRAYLENLVIIGNDSGDLDINQKVLNTITNSGLAGLTSREIGRACRPFARLTPDARQGLIDGLKDDLVIREVKTARATKYVSSKFYTVENNKEVI